MALAEPVQQGFDDYFKLMDRAVPQYILYREDMVMTDGYAMHVCPLNELTRFKYWSLRLELFFEKIDFIFGSSRDALCEFIERCKLRRYEIYRRTGK